VAVLSEPVSAIISLISGKNTGNFCPIGHFTRKLTSS